MSAFALTACATAMTVSSHVDRSADFSTYRTYDWGPADALPTGDPRLDADPFFKDQLQGEVDRQLALRGTSAAASDNADLLIHYHAHISQRLDVRGADASFGYTYDNGSEVYEYEAGTIVLDVVDARTQKVVWRGWAQDAVAGMLRNDDTLAKKVREAVTRMFADMPAELRRPRS
jgi:hypothetical protein